MVTRESHKLQLLVQLEVSAPGSKNKCSSYFHMVAVQGAVPCRATMLGYDVMVA